MILRRPLAALCLSFSLAGAFAASTITAPDLNEASWRSLQSAEAEFRAGRYGDAIRLCEEAKRRRNDECSYEVLVLENALKSREVSKEGDFLPDVVKALERREADQALKIISHYTRLFGAEKFSNSISALSRYVAGRSKYPEADYLIGKIYRYEGEFARAEQYYMSAYKESGLLEIPDVKYDILYDMADMAYVQGKDDDYEKYLTLIIKEDTSYWDSGLDRALIRAIDSDAKDSVEKFFKLYRSKEQHSLRAYELLAEYYTSTRQDEKAMKAIAFAVLTGFSKMYDIAKERNNQFAYKDVASFFKELCRYEDITEWGVENDIWKSFYTLGEYAERRGKGVFARKLFEVIAESFPEEYWRGKAANKIARIQ